MANEEQPKKDWKVLERHYKALSEVWEHSYKDQTQIPEALMILQGCLIEMHSDLIVFEQKNGNKSVQKSKQRLALLTEKIQVISSIQSDNYSLKFHNKKLLKENNDLRIRLGEKIRIDNNENKLKDLPDSIPL